MGSFTEGVLSFEFREDVPDHVLAAFSSLYEPDLNSDYPQPPPSLPPPVIEIDDDWTPDTEVYDGLDTSELLGRLDDMTDVVQLLEQSGPADPFAAVEPWKHDWGYALAMTMTVHGMPSGTLAWNGRRWQLSSRFFWKTSSDIAFLAMRWFGPYVSAARVPTDSPGRFLGYLRHDSEPRPNLVWARDGALELEDLNSGGFW